MKTLHITVLTASLLACEAASQSDEPRMPPLEGVTCATCHTCDVPTKENPCIRTCPRLRMATVHQSADAAPDVIELRESKKTAGQFLPVKFSHGWHAEMSSMSGGCTLCHHYNPPGRVLACRECHPAERKRAAIGRPDLRGAYHRQCIDCHRQWEYTTACEGCHAYRGTATTGTDSGAAGAYPKRRHPVVNSPARLVYETTYPVGPTVTFYHDEHAGKFQLECQDCHSRESCIRCHDRRKGESAGPRAPRETHSSCSPCHKTDADCGTCHGTAVKERFDHQKRTGWPLGRFHSTLECSRCHVKKGTFAGIVGTCESCHGKWEAPAFNHSVTGLALDDTHRELDCSVCHEDDRYARTPGCSGCHEEYGYPGKVPGRRVPRRGR